MARRPKRKSPTKERANLATIKRKSRNRQKNVLNGTLNTAASSLCSNKQSIIAGITKDIDIGIICDLTNNSDVATTSKKQRKKRLRKRVSSKKRKTLGKISANNNLYKTIDLAEDDTNDDVILVNDSVILVNDGDENDVVYVTDDVSVQDVQNSNPDESVILIEDDSMVEEPPLSNLIDEKCENQILPTTLAQGIAAPKKLELIPCPFNVISNDNPKGTGGNGHYNKLLPVQCSKREEENPARISTVTTLAHIRNESHKFCSMSSLTNDLVNMQVEQPVIIPGSAEYILQQLSTQIGNSKLSVFSNVGPNFVNVGPIRTTGLRPIYIDGSNIAISHGSNQGGKHFSVKGLKICIDYFKLRGHEVTAILPSFRKKMRQNSDSKLLQSLEKEGTIIFTPSRYVNGRTIVPYDDRYIVLLAHVHKGIVVSSDNFRDLLKENPDLLDTIENRVLTPTWVKDMLIFPIDPMGRNGPTLDEFLRFP